MFCCLIWLRISSNYQDIHQKPFLPMTQPRSTEHSISASPGRKSWCVLHMSLAKAHKLMVPEPQQWRWFWKISERGDIANNSISVKQAIEKIEYCSGRVVSECNQVIKIPSSVPPEFLYGRCEGREECIFVYVTLRDLMKLSGPSHDRKVSFNNEFNNFLFQLLANVVVPDKLPNFPYIFYLRYHSAYCKNK